MGVISKYYYTLKDLKRIQIVHQLFNKIRKKKYKHLKTQANCKYLNFSNSAYSKFIYSRKNTFSFLNLEHAFSAEVEWNFLQNGKLWNYNLNYFEFLNQVDFAKEEGVNLIRSWIQKPEVEPYPTSLRLINWIRFVSLHKIDDSEILESIDSQAQYLSKNIEYHLLGNHLLENGFALLQSGYFLGREDLLVLGESILQEQMAEQILQDGAHFELSPMYHMIILNRVLETIDLVQNNDRDERCRKLHDILVEKASMMLSWLRSMVFRNGKLPHVNDSTDEISPTYSYILNAAENLAIPLTEKTLKESGYRKLQNEIAEVVVDVGNIGPSYIPGHAHSDTLNFILHLNKQAIIVDTGISAYEKNEVRQNERSTIAHNTVAINHEEQSEVWGGFRVARKAKISSLIEGVNEITASHTGYLRIGSIHERTFELKDKQLFIEDRISNGYSGEAYFHFDHNIKLIQDAFVISWEANYIDFNNAKSVEIKSYNQALGFNKTKNAKFVVVTFETFLHTRFYFK